jgi:glycosyltransferase involved in cell wall biosynthesis
MRAEKAAMRNRLRIADSPKPGVNLVGFLEAESGLGEFARRLAGALDAGDIPFAAIPYRRTLGRQDFPLEIPLAEEAPFDVNLISLSADHLTRFAAEVDSAFFSRRYSIGVWFWETNVFSSGNRVAARFLDELWVGSEYVRDAVAPDVDIPVHVVPVPVERPRGPLLSRTELGVPDVFTFLFVFDFWSGPRKNPTAVVDAFTRAFRPGEGPMLILKSVHGRDWKPRQLEQLLTTAAGRMDVVVRDGYLSAGERDSLLASCDCYISLHRSEGLGLTMAEAMALGKPVIATGYSGNLDFMNEQNSYLVPFELIDVPSDWWAFTPGAVWAEPDVDAAARLMRKVWELPDEAQAVGLRGREQLLRRFAPERTAAFVERRLREARDRGAIAARASAHDARPAIVEASLGSETSPGHSLGAPSRLHPRSLVRGFLRRALWPYLEHERRLDGTVVEALSTLQRSVDVLEERILRLEGGAHATPTDPDATDSRPSRS